VESYYISDYRALGKPSEPASVIGEVLTSGLYQLIVN
jgi:hypothetical protein